jgi:hypothetical protein
MTIKFQKFYVTNGETKARVFYSNSTLIDGRKCVTLYAKDYSRNLGAIFGDSYENATDSQTDYFDEGHVRIFPDSPHYAAALARAS